MLVLNTSVSFDVCCDRSMLKIKIYRYRIQNVIKKSALEVPSAMKEHLIYQKIVHAVVTHRKAIESVFLNL